MIEYSIVLPAYNESPRLERNLILLDELMQRLDEPYEIIIAEDGSSDGTYLIAKELAERKDNIRLLHSKERLGKGAAISRAIRESKGQIVAFIDADLAVDLQDLVSLLRSVEENKIVVGSRWVKESQVKRSLLSSLASKAYNNCASLLFKDNVRDRQCGLKGFTRHAALNVLPKMRSTGWVWDTEFILRTMKAGYKVYEMPISWREPRKRASLKTLRLAPVIALELLKLWIRERRF